MSEKEKNFKPDTIDTQLDELIHQPQLPNANPDVRTVQALQQIYKSQAAQEAASIDRVFKRFARQAADKDTLLKDQQESAVSTQTTALLKSNPLDASTNIGKIQGNRLLMQKQHHSTARQAGIAIAAVLALALIAGSAISFLLIANTRVSSPPKKIVTNATAQAKPTMMHTMAPTTTPMPQPQTTCPAVGTSRAAILPPLAQKEGQSIVYTTAETDNQSNEMHWLESYSIDRYDIANGQTTSLLTIDTSNANSNTMYIREANFSTDGQWIVLGLASRDTPGSIPNMIQLLRADGQYRQTLYCGPAGQYINHAYLSPDMKSLVFDMTPTSAPSAPTTGIYRLDLENGGSIHTLLTQQPEAELGLVYQPTTWIDNNHILVNMFGTVSVKDAQGVYGYAPGKIMNLDITQGDNQQIAQLPILLDQTNSCQKFDISPDRSFLVIAQCQSVVTANNSASWSSTNTILLKNISTGATQTILSHDSQPIMSVHIVSNTIVLFNTIDPNKSSSLWRINSDGTGLTELVKVSIPISPYIDLGAGEYGQPSVYISDDGSRYLVIEEGQAASNNGPLLQVSYMPSSGGNLVTIEPPQKQQIINVLGWTSY